jgi:hypothetical protein
MNKSINSFRGLVLVIGVLFSIQGCGSQNVQGTGAVKNESTAPAAVENKPVVDEAVKSDAGSKKNVGAKIRPDGTFRMFPIYTDGESPDNHYVPSGWMGDYGDIKANDKYLTNPHAGTTSTQIVYTNKASQGARWAGIYWQNPPNNWGTRPGGYDLTGAKKLTFWARGDKGGERIEEFKLGGITGEYADSDVAGIGPVVLTKDWQQYTIDLEGKDLSSISGGFCWATNLDVNPDGATFYLDDIRYE